jgi:putative hydrolase of HD superfamily
VAQAPHAQRLRLAYAALALKDEPRSGWAQHGVSNPESVAAHAWGTAYLCLLFAEEAGVDRNRAVAIAVLHDLAEATTGDVAARLDPADRQVSEQRKSQLEHEAIQALLPETVADLRALWLEYEERSSPEALFVRDMNLIDMCLQGLLYEADVRYDPSVLIPSRGGHRHLDEFFSGAEARLSGELARQLFGTIHTWYLAARRDPT